MEKTVDVLNEGFIKKTLNVIDRGLVSGIGMAESPTIL